MASTQGEDSPQPPPQSPPRHPTSTIPKRKPVPVASPAPAPAGPPEAVASPEGASPPGATVSQQATAPPNAAAQNVAAPVALEKGPTLEWEAARSNSSGGRKLKFAWPFAVPSFRKLKEAIDEKLPFANDRRKRRLLVGGIIAGVVIIIALIIGLAVGLARKHTSNLPLPTNHGGPYTGDLTYYTPALGACGTTSTDSDAICAVSHIIFDAASRGSDPNANPLCGLKIRLRREGKSVDVTVVDRCVGCKATDIDTTTSVFSQLADIDQGRVTVQWAWLENAPVEM